MRLFHIDAGKEWRGGQRQSFFLAKELKRKGYSSLFVVQPNSPLHRRASEERLPVFPLKMRNELDLIAMLKLAKVMKRKKCILAHFHDAHSAAVGSVASSLAKVPIRIVTRRVVFPLKKNLFSRYKYRKNIDCIIAISKGVKKVLIEGGIKPRRIEVIPSGIDFTSFDKISYSDYLHRELSFDPDNFLVGIVAYLADNKGHEFLIEATKILKEHSPKIKVIIVGKGPLKMELNKQARESNVEDIVFFLGFREDVPEILSSLDLFVLSSHFEGLGSSILDAMVYHLPVVATKTGGIPEVVIHGETGLLVPPGNPLELAKAILKLYNNRALASRLGERGYEMVRRKFSAESMAERIVRLYEKIASKKGIKLYGPA